MSYKSPIEIIYGDMQTRIEGEVLKAVQAVDVKVNKQELLDILNGDRETYIQGYNDALYDIGEKIERILEEMRLKP